MYLFMRKILEKNNWSIKLGEDMLNAYDSVKQITKNELETLSLMLLYPEKFWKITNYYYNSNNCLLYTSLLQTVHFSELNHSISDQLPQRRPVPDLFQIPRR